MYMTNMKKINNKKILTVSIKITAVTVAAVTVAAALIITGCKKEQRYAFVTTPSGLVMREKFGVQATRIGLIPCGSKVKVTETEGPEEVINGIQGRWRQVIYNGKEGWAFDGYLRLLKQELGNKISRGSYSLKATSEEGISSSDSGYTAVDEIQFSGNGGVKFISTIYMFATQDITEYEGTSSYDNEEITLVLNKGIRKKFYMEPPDSRKVLKQQDEVPGKTVILHWSESLKAFVRKADMKLLDDSTNLIKTKECAIISAQDEKNKDMPGSHFKTTGYFCER